MNTSTTADRAEFDVINPATGESFATCKATPLDDLDRIVQQSQEAAMGWRADLDARRDALRRCAKALTKRRNTSDLAKLLTQEQGKPFKDAMKEVYGASHWFASIAEMELSSPTLPAGHEGVGLSYQPLGVVAAIVPWNFPLLLAVSKIAPALLAGNSVVLKPSPFTPLATQAMCEMFNEQPTSKSEPTPALPPGVLQMVAGDGDLGRALIDHPGINKVSFTGSTATGKAIARQAAGDLKRLTLELGGNDAAIVLEDADVDQIAESIFWGAFANSGQFCVGIKRLYVQQSLFEALVQRLVDIANSIKVDDGSVAGTQMGPIANAPQFQRIVGLAEQAVANGATLRCGGIPLDRAGYFFPPTIATCVDDNNPLVAEEQFGPILPVLAFQDEDEAVRRANVSPFGLGGSVWTGNFDRGVAIARRLECGTAWVNQHGVLDPLIPFGGMKQSGVGHENGTLGVREFQRLQVINGIQASQP
ncbi:MAG: aldehyde dehydrogenase family protein [Planctomycetota bacterium]|nr:aldehyde dehydrogenase family protein [Planctomycetota bacterium]